MNIKCDRCSNKTYNPNYCLQCHKPHCFDCQRVHSQNYSNHVFKFPTFHYNRARCEIHNHEGFISYCSNCRTMVCIDCIQYSHGSHKIIEFCELKNEQEEQVKREKIDIGEILKTIRYEIDKREGKIRLFKNQLTDIVDSFPYGSMYSLGKQEPYTGELRRRWSDIETKPPLELDIICTQTKQLKASKYFYEEIQNTLTRIMSANGDEQFISRFSQYQNSIEICTKTPAKCEEDPELEILYEQTSNGDSKHPYFIIQIRKKVTEPTRATIPTVKTHVQQQEESMTTISNVKRQEFQKRDEFGTGFTSRMGRTENIPVQQGGGEELNTEFRLKSDESRKKHELATGLTDRAVQKQREELTQLKSELYSKTVEAQLLRETLELTSRNIQNLKDKCEGKPMESVALICQRPASLYNLKEVEHMVSNNEQCLVALLKTLNEKSSASEFEIHNKDRELKISNDKLIHLNERFDLLEKENASLKIALRATKQNKDEMHLRPLVQEKNRELEGIKTRLANFQHSYGQLENENVSLKTVLQGNIQDKNELIIRVQHVEEENASISNNLEKKSRENEDLKTRLSQVAGAKLMAGNTSIADLGDKYRPTRIAELYSELYDNEWTEAVDDLVSKKWSEDKIVRHLFIILQGCYKACCQLASQQMQDLVRKMFLDTSSSADVRQFLKQHTTEIKQLQDARKAIAIDVAHVISKDFDRNTTFVEYLRYYREADEEIVYQITQQKFFEKCITLSWLMAVQDPEMYMEEDVKQGTKFDKDRYREYTKSGTMFLCSIWPALYLHKNGPLMIKGVAQACG